jgi:hypothetical protein
MRRRSCAAQRERSRLRRLRLPSGRARTNEVVCSAPALLYRCVLASPCGFHSSLLWAARMAVHHRGCNGHAQTSGHTYSSISTDVAGTHPPSPTSSHTCTGVCTHALQNARAGASGHLIPAVCTRLACNLALQGIASAIDCQRPAERCANWLPICGKRQSIASRRHSIRRSFLPFLSPSATRTISLMSAALCASSR